MRGCIKYLTSKPAKCRLCGGADPASIRGPRGGRPCIPSSQGFADLQSWFLKVFNGSEGE